MLNESKTGGAEAIGGELKVKKTGMEERIVHLIRQTVREKRRSGSGKKKREQHKGESCSRCIDS